MELLPVEVGPKGRIVIPAPLRASLGLGEGARLLAFEQDGTVVLATREAIMQRLWDRFAGIDTSLADELVAERRAEATRDASAS
jgi:AbrB family looped-hinge helix DNA binding protein